MKIYYIDNLRLPTEKAHSVQIMKMCEALASSGNEITLLLPKKKTPITDDPFEYYDIKKNFELKKIWSVNFIYFEKILGSFGYWLENLIFTKLALFWIFLEGKPDVIYTRQPLIAFGFRIFYKEVYFEAHTFKSNWLYKFLLRRVAGIVVITNKLKELYQQILPKQNYLVAPDGVDLKKFDLPLDQRQIREKVGLPTDKKIVLYLGSLIKWKGADILAEAATKADPQIQFYFVGGSQGDVDTYKNNYPQANIHFVGHKAYQEVHFWLKSANILVIPNSGKFKISKYYTSPMKLFEYLAVRVPIISADLPSLREILDENCALFFEPDNSADLLNKINIALTDEELGQKLVLSGYQKAVRYSWENRADHLINFIK